MDFNFANLSSTFKHLGNHALAGGKTIGRSDAYGETVKSSYQLVRDEFTLSDAGRAAYAKFVNKPGTSQSETQQSEPQSEDCAVQTTVAQDAEKPAEFIPQLTLNADGTATISNPDGTTTQIQPLTERPVFDRSAEGTAITGWTVPQSVSEAMDALWNFRDQVRLELVVLLPPSPGTMPGTNWLDWLTSASSITNNIFAQAQIKSPWELYFSEGIEDMTAWTAEFDAFREQVTKGLQDLREITDIRARLAFEGDRGLFSRPLGGISNRGEIESIVLGTNEVLFDGRPLFNQQTGITLLVMAGGQGTDLEWLRQVDKVATREGLQAAFAREDRNVLGADGRGTSYDWNFAYYDWEKGTQTLVKITWVNSLDGGKSFIQNDEERPFTITATEYSLKDPNDKGKVLGEASGKDYFAWLGSSDNFLPHIGGKGFQKWREEVAALSPLLGASNSAPAKNSFSQLGKLLGLEGTFATKESLLDALNKLIDEEGKELNKLLSGKLKEAGLGDVTKKITFAEDKDGNIVIEGNLSAKQKKKLAKLINDDPELVERIKTQKARQEFARGIEEDDIDNKKYNAARTQLLKDVFARHGTSLDDLDPNRLLLPEDQRDAKYENLYNLMGAFPELHDEIWAYMDRRETESKEADALAKLEIAEALKVSDGKGEKSTAVRSLLSMKRGELSEAIENEWNFNLELLQLRAGIFKALEHKADDENPIDGYNTTYNRVDPNWVISDFDIEFDHKGKMRFSNVQTAGGDAKSIEAATRALHMLFKPDMADDLGLAILEAHDDVHGDVEEFKHKVVYEGGIGSGYRVESQEADKAALEEIDSLLADIGSAFGEFFGKTLGIENPFAIIFGADGHLSLEVGGLTALEARAVRSVLSDLNKFLAAEEAGEEMEDKLRPELLAIGEKLVELQEAKGKLHDQSLLPKEGWRFEF